jgi:hypothetical protein
MSNPNLSQEARIWGMLCHLSSLAWIPLGLLVSWYLSFAYVPIYIPGANILAPFIIWKFKKAQHPFINEQGKESLNYQIAMMKNIAVGVIILFFFFFGTCGIVLGSINQALLDYSLFILLICFYLMSVLLLINQLIYASFASIKAYKGELYRYPDTIRYLR